MSKNIKSFEEEFSNILNDDITLKDLLYHFVTKFPSNDPSYKKIFAEDIVGNKFVNKKLSSRKLMEFIDFEMRHFDKSKIEKPEKKIIPRPKKANTGISIYDVDVMDPFEFESFIAKLLEYEGYSTEVTKKSGDQGVDILAEKDGEKWAIQTKRYELGKKISNKAVQEVHTGKGFYKCQRAAVLTNQFFTDSARQIADATNVILWDRRFVASLLEKLRESNTVKEEMP